MTRYWIEVSIITILICVTVVHSYLSVQYKKDKALFYKYVTCAVGAGVAAFIFIIFVLKIYKQMVGT
jgi:hypothetical protein